MRYLVVVMILLVGCTSRPSEGYSVGNRLLEERFDTSFAWEQAQMDEISLLVVDGVYEIRSNVNSYVNGFYRNDTFDNVVIDIQTQQVSSEDNNAYGVVCRGSVSQSRVTGYYFLIGGDGTYSIQKGQDDDLHPLVTWAHHGAIHEGEAYNQIRVICVDDYLALYVNDKFVADVRDQTYKTGRIGVVAATAEDTIIQVRFDNLMVYEGILGGN